MLSVILRGILLKVNRWYYMAIVRAFFSTGVVGVEKYDIFAKGGDEF